MLHFCKLVLILVRLIQVEYVLEIFLPLTSLSALRDTLMSRETELAKVKKELDELQEFKVRVVWRPITNVLISRWITDPYHKPEVQMNLTLTVMFCSWSATAFAYTGLSYSRDIPVC